MENSLEPKGNAPLVVCVNHPEIPGPITCQDCSASICELCQFAGPDDAALCPACFEKAEKAPRVVDPAAPDPMLEGRMCSLHPENDATHRCQACGARVCKTCDFLVSGAVHLCPTCATEPRREMSGSRKKRLVISYVLAAVATVAFIFLMEGAAGEDYTAPEDEMILGYIFSFTVLIPAIVGLALAMGVRDKRLHNPGAVMGAIVWNSIMLVIFLLLSVVGIFMP